MGSTGDRSSRRDFMIVLVGLVIVGSVFVMIPRFGRALDIMLGVLALAAIGTAILARRDWLRSLALVIVSLAVILYACEMLQKFFGLVSPVRTSVVTGQEGKYPWVFGYGPSYIEARERALADGIPLEGKFAGEIFAGPPRPDLHVLSTDSVLKDIKGHTESLKPLYTHQSPLGYELSPDNLWRGYAYAAKTGETLFDNSVTTDAHGIRVTPGNADAETTVLFMGCSFTFGTYLNDNETLAYHFSELAGFEHNVVNLGIGGWGPAHVLRDMELNRRTGFAVKDPATVKMVVYTLMTDHANRMTRPLYGPTPMYRFEDGMLVLGAITEAEGPQGFFSSRVARLMERSRVWKAFSTRFQQKNEEKYRWRLAIAAIERIDEICRERYGVPLTVVWWDGPSEAIEDLERRGIEMIPVHRAFAEGEDWHSVRIKYSLFDSHPSAFGNRKVAEMLYGRLSAQVGN